VTDAPRRYDRDLLLLGSKRNAVLSLSEVQRFGAESYGDPDYVSLYSSSPRDWYAKGARVLGRTAVECTRDQLADAIGRDTARIASSRLQLAPRLSTVVLDPFAGSANTLYWMQRHLEARRAVGFEADAGVFALTRRNLELLQLPIEYIQVDYVHGLAHVSVSSDDLVVAVIAPPWGGALTRDHGLDLRRTSPPVLDIVEALRRTFAQPILFVIQTYERLAPGSLDGLRHLFDWSDLHTYNLNRAGENHGVLFATSARTSRFPGLHPS
jgi:hypothetical protein